MRKSLKRLAICFILVLFIWCLDIVSEKQELQENLIRLHVVANSDRIADQAVILKVRDAALESMQQDLVSITDISSAKEYLEENIPRIREVVNTTLTENGYPECLSVSLCKERFNTRAYDAFALPAGIYNSLRIIIDNG